MHHGRITTNCGSSATFQIELGRERGDGECAVFDTKGHRLKTKRNSYWSKKQRSSYKMITYVLYRENLLRLSKKTMILQKTRNNL